MRVESETSLNSKNFGGLAIFTIIKFWLLRMFANFNMSPIFDRKIQTVSVDI